MLGNAHDVWGFDSSQKAVALARANAELNGVTNARFDPGDCFAVLETLAARHERFGAAVVDPPKFARSRGAVDEALRAYHHLNRLAIGVLEPGGILVTCSCSGHVSREDFLYMLVGVAQQSKRDIQILEAARRRPGPSGERDVPGDRVFEVLYLPGAVIGGIGRTVIEPQRHRGTKRNARKVREPGAENRQ